MKNRPFLKSWALFCIYIWFLRWPRKELQNSETVLVTPMAQNNYVDELIKRNGRPLDYEVKKYKKAARIPARRRIMARRLHGLKAKIFSKRCKEAKTERLRRTKKQGSSYLPSTDPVPHFLLDRDIQGGPSEVSRLIKEKRKNTISKYAVPLAQVKGVSEVEAFRSITTGRKRKNHWKRMVLKPCFVGEDFTRKPPKFERFIRPMAMRFKKAHVVHPELKATFNLPIIGIKKNPHSELYTSLGVLSKGTIIEVNVSELGMVASSGKIVWGKYAQVTNKPEDDGCVNAILLM